MGSYRQVLFLFTFFGLKIKQYNFLEMSVKNVKIVEPLYEYRSAVYISD